VALSCRGSGTRGIGSLGPERPRGVTPWRWARAALTVARLDARAALRGGVAPALCLAYACASVAALFTLTPLTDGAEVSLTPLFEVGSALLPALAPALTMGLIAGERASGHLDALLATPSPYGVLVCAKWLSALALCALALLCTLPAPLILWRYAALPLPPALAAYLALLLSAALHCALGVWASARASRPVGAWVWAFGAGLALASLDALAPHLGARERLTRAFKGVIDGRDVFYFICLTALCLISATRALLGAALRPR
jgi:ABC-2 type transport system permease protein